LPLDAVKIVLFLFRIGSHFDAGLWAAIPDSHPAQPFLDALAEFVGFSAHFGVREFLHLGLERVDGLDLGYQRLDDALVLRAKNPT